jgi:hypothetical protein
MKSSRLIALVWVLPVVLAPGATAPAQSPGGQAPARPGVVLLHSGEVLEGRISETPEYFRITLPNGEIRVRKTEVDCCCADLHEAYQRLRAGTSNDANEHLRLAQWCLRQGLLDVAAQEVDTAATLNPQHPMIEPLRRRLEMSNQRSQASAGPARPGNPYTLAEELDRMLRTLPPGSIEYFTQRVQPLLMNNCTTSSCHGPQSETAFRLFRIPSDRPASRRLTQRNLYTALQWIDRENPAASKLLTVPLAPHGTAKTPMFADVQAAQFRLLAEWVDQVTRHGGQESSVATLDSEPSFFPETPAPAESPAHHAHKKHAPSKAHAPGDQGASGPRAAAAKGSAAPQGDRQSAGSTGVAKAAATTPCPKALPADSADPLDPEAFNRRFFGP